MHADHEGDRPEGQADAGCTSYLQHQQAGRQPSQRSAQRRGDQVDRCGSTPISGMISRSGRWRGWRCRHRCLQEEPQHAASASAAQKATSCVPLRRSSRPRSIERHVDAEVAELRCRRSASPPCRKNSTPPVTSTWLIGGEDSTGPTPPGAMQPSTPMIDDDRQAGGEGQGQRPAELGVEEPDGIHADHHQLGIADPDHVDDAEHQVEAERQQGERPPSRMPLSSASSRKMSKIHRLNGLRGRPAANVGLGSELGGTPPAAMRPVSST